MRMLAILLLLAGCAEVGEAPIAASPPPTAAEAATEAAPPRPIHLTRTVNVPLAPVARRRREMAPLANRDIEAPSTDPGDPLAPTLAPMVLPEERQFGVTFGREHLRETGQGGPFDSVVRGARIVIPLEPTAPPR